MENRGLLLNESKEEKIEKVKKIYTLSPDKDGDKPISQYSSDELRNKLLKNTTESLIFSNESTFGVLSNEMASVFLNKDRFLQPCYENLTMEQLPVPLYYNHEQTDGVSIKQYAAGTKGKYTRPEKRHLSAAMKISDEQFLKTWASNAFITIDQLYSYDEKTKEKLVSAIINDLLAYTVGSKSIDYCFGKLSEDAYKSFSSNGFDPNNPEHAHLHSIFTHYLTTEELQSSPKELRKSIIKFRV